MKEKPNLMEIAKKNQKLSTFSYALAAVDLDAMLENEGPFTVLAPSNEAFRNLQEFEELTCRDRKSQLKNLLSALILPGRVPFQELVEERDVETISSGSRMVENRQHVAIVKRKVVNPGIEAANGVIHILDKVRMPNSTLPIANR